MSELILTLHIASGIVAILASLSAFFRKLSKLSVLFWPSLSLVTVTGFGMIFTGVSLARVCASGIVLTISLLLIRYLASNRSVLNKVYSRLTTFIDI